MGFLKSLRDKISSESTPTTTTSNTSSQRPQDNKIDSSLYPAQTSKRKTSHESLNQYEPPPGPPPSHPKNQHDDHTEYEPPEGPPPSTSAFSKLSLNPESEDDEYLPPDGPPPSHDQKQSQHESEYEAPPGPPPSHMKAESKSSTQSQTQEPQVDLPPPTYETWLSHPYNDNASLPPPPSLPQEFSPTNNASFDSADRGAEFCRKFHPTAPSVPSVEIYNSAINPEEIQMEKPPANTFLGELNIEHIPKKTGGNVRIRSMPKMKQQQRGSRRLVQQEILDSDVSVMTRLPIYFALVDNPHLSGRSIQQQQQYITNQIPNTGQTSSNRNSKTIFFSIVIVSLPSSPPSGVAIGFAARPYPPFRLPGWHRGSLAVHSDDGRRYINDPYGGREFVKPFKKGDEVGLGVTFTFDPNAQLVENQGKASKVEAFFVVNGKEMGRWDVMEERDAEFSGGDGLLGLLGETDLYAVVGLFGAVEVLVKF